MRPFPGHAAPPRPAEGAAGWTGVVGERARGEAVGGSGEVAGWAGEVPAEVTVNLAPSAPRAVGWRGAVDTGRLFV